MSEWADVSKQVTYGMAVAVGGLALAAEVLGGGRGIGATENATVPAFHAANVGADMGGGGGWQGQGDAREGGTEKPARAKARGTWREVGRWAWGTCWGSESLKVDGGVGCAGHNRQLRESQLDHVMDEQKNGFIHHMIRTPVFS